MSRINDDPVQAIYNLLVELLYETRRIRRMLEPRTPTFITFKEITMNAPDPGNTLVFTGTLSPTGAAFPAGTTFSASSADSGSVSVAIDPTGLILTVTISPNATPGTTADITWNTSTFTPEPSTSPASLSATIPLVIGSVAPPPTPTPTAVTFQQTT